MELEIAMSSPIILNPLIMLRRRLFYLKFPGSWICHFVRIFKFCRFEIRSLKNSYV